VTLCRSRWRLGLLVGLGFLAANAAAAFEVGPGRLLVATDEVRGTVFAEAVIFLLEYGPEGAVGLIVNRPLSAPLESLLPDVTGLSGRGDRAWLGGPVSPGELLLLVHSDEPIEGASRVAPGILASRSAATLTALLADASAPSFRAYAGYSGWGPRQLDVELARGAWVVAPAERATVFPEQPASLWQRLLRLFQPLRAAIQSRS